MSALIRSTFVAVLLLGPWSRVAALAEAAQQSWLAVDIGIIGPASEDILNAAVRQAETQYKTGLVIRLDTPGGSLESTRNMVKSIMSAKFPVVVWVGPNGSRAASAGAFIALSANVASMAPGTNIGAAHPVEGNGSDIKAGDIKLKVENDTAAFIESIAKTRGRNAEMAVSFVLTSTSITAEEAKTHNIIDLVAADESALMQGLDGRVVTLPSGEKLTLATKTATLTSYESTIRQRLLALLSNPNLFYLLFLAGMIGLGFELTHPGVVLPGVVGSICMLLALIATSVLPINLGGLALLVAGIGFLVAEAFLPAYGVLGIGGLAAFVIGSVLLVDPGDTTGLRISWYTIAPGALVIAASVTGICYLVLRAHRSRAATGSEGMVGQTAAAIADFVDGRGRVRIEGENWSATLEGNTGLIRAGDQVRVVAIKNLELIVAPTKP